MSIKQEHYIMIGANLINYMIILNKMEQVQSINKQDEFDKKMEQVKQLGLDYVYDDVNNDYLIIGKIIKKCNECDGIPFTEINPNGYIQAQKVIKEKIKKLFNKDVDPKLMIFTYWS